MSNRCPIRDECWNQLNARAIDKGTDTPGRKFPCGFEANGDLHFCPRLSQQGSLYLESAIEAETQLTMDLPETG